MTVTIKPSSDPVPASDTGETARGRKRDSLFLMARLRVGADTATHDVRVRNLSEGGLMAEYERPVAVDTAVSLELRGVGAVSGRVAWCEAQRLGIAFDQPINPKLARKPVGRTKSIGFQAKVPPRR